MSIEIEGNMTKHNPPPQQKRPTQPAKPSQSQQPSLKTQSKSKSKSKTQTKSRKPASRLPPPPQSARQRQRQRQRRLALGGNSRSQKTLTQIDFVTRAHVRALIEQEDEGLGYIEEGEGTKKEEEQNADHDEEVDEGDGEYGVTNRSSRKKSKEGKGNRDAKGRWISTGKPKSGRNTRRKVLDVDDEHDATLTQIGYVSRHDGRDDEELKTSLKLGVPQPRYRDPLGEKKRASPMETISEEPEVGPGYDDVHENGNGRDGVRPKKRKLSDEGVKLASSRQTSADPNAFPMAPTTPKKPSRLVIPSSQSPDSPDLLSCPWLFKETPPRFPLAPVSRNTALRRRGESPSLKDENASSLKSCRVPQYEIPESSFAVATPGSPARNCGPGTPAGSKTTPARYPPVEPEEDSGKTATILSHEAADGLPEDECGTGPRTQNTATNASQRFRNKIIYETDGESEDEEVHDTTSHISADENDSWRTQSQLIPSDNKSQDDNNLDDLPTQNHHKNSHRETFDDLPPTTPGSEPSILYYRKPMSLAFDPMSELNDIDSQKLAELFPEAEMEIHESVTAPLSTIAEGNEEEEDDAPTQTSGKDPADIVTEFVPDSPARPRQEPAGKENFLPPSSPPIVLVASSQDNETGDPLTNRTESQIDGQGLVTASQLLTDSMMESVPGPPMWMSSQGLVEEGDE
ncbi:hypothetical protein FQN50_003786 [Emmonsiellopsis sp. PD_5]|nr:hypothetical protein FQN50_003786 [Emmonsiellopsis sp. PD_5]